MQAQKLHQSVHDWIGKTVWNDKDGYLFPELEYPTPGKSVIYVDYERISEEALVQADVEKEVDRMGYPAGPRWIGRNSLDAENVVSYVGMFPHEEVAQHLENLQGIVRAEALVVKTY